MVKYCTSCSNSLARSTKGELCGDCYRNRNNTQSSQASQGNTSSVEDLYAGFISVEQIQNLPELPTNWVNEPSHRLSGGHLLKIITQANNMLLSQISTLHEVVSNLQDEVSTHKIKCGKNEEKLNQNVEQIDKQDKEINTLKTVILNQQLFIEKSQRVLLAKNLMITGIPRNDVEWGENRYTDKKEKVEAVLEAIEANLTEDSYELKVFDADTDRPTFAAKLIFNDTETKNTVLVKASKLRECECEQLKKVYIKNDETKLASKENYRLRQKRRNLIKEHPNAVFKIEKGKLLQDGMEVDKFDLNNQIFC